MNRKENILAFVRSKGEDKILALFNMTQNETQVTLNSEIINESYFDFDNDKPVIVKDGLNIIMKPWSYKLYYTID